MPRFYFGTNFKMHQTATVSRDFVRTLRQNTDDLTDVQLFVIPPYTSLAGLPELAGDPLWVGAQNMHDADAGEYTGEIAAPMLTALGVRMVMLGHAERRHRFGESDILINRKMQAAQRHDMRMLLCVGETADEKHYGVGRETVARQLKIALHGVTSERLLVAYEPVWSIGEGGQPATVEEVAQTVEQIHETLAELYPDNNIPVLYGGSVNEDNCADYAAMGLIDGLFVGRAARQPEGFLRVLRLALAAHDRK